MRAEPGDKSRASREAAWRAFSARAAAQAAVGPTAPAWRPTAASSLLPGQLFVHRATALFDVEWAILASEQGGRGRALIVAVDGQAIHGPGDLLVPGDEPCGALTIRCSVGLRVPAAAFARAPVTGFVPARYLERAKVLWRKPPNRSRWHEVDLENLEYREHMNRLQEASRCLAGWCQALDEAEPGGHGPAPNEVAEAGEDRIGQLYDEIARLSGLEDEPSLQALRKAWADLRRLQREEARRDREAFEASLAMPIDAGRRILERARASRERFEDLAARHRAAG